MEQKLNAIKADLHNVFVEGNASSNQLAKIFFVLAIPVLLIFMIGCH